MPSRVKILKMKAMIGGIWVDIGTVKIEPWGKEVQKVKLVRVTPCHKEKPVPVEEEPWKGKFVAYAYKCPVCGKVYHSWRDLIEVEAQSLNPISRKLPGDKGVLYLKRFTENQIDAYGPMIPIMHWVPVPHGKDQEVTKENLMKLALASNQLGQIIVGKWNDGEKHHVAYLDLTPDGKVVLVEFIPLNLVEETANPLDLTVSAIGQKEVEMAKRFVGMIEQGGKKHLEAQDWRAGAFQAPETKRKTPSLEEILAAFEGKPKERKKVKLV